MVTLKLKGYSKAEKLNLYRLLKSCSITVKSKQGCEEKSCTDCFNYYLCKDLQKTVKFLEKEISAN